MELREERDTTIREQLEEIDHLQQLGLGGFFDEVFDLGSSIFLLMEMAISCKLVQNKNGIGMPDAAWGRQTEARRFGGLCIGLAQSPTCA